MIGSYSPLRQAKSPIAQTRHLLGNELNKMAIYNSDHSEPVTSGGHAHTNASSLTSTDGRGIQTHCSRVPAGDATRRPFLEHAQNLNQDTVKREELQEELSDGKTSGSSRLDEVGKSSCDAGDHGDGLRGACDGTAGSLSEDNSDVGPQSESCHDEEHRTLSVQWKENRPRQNSSEWEVVTMGQYEHALNALEQEKHTTTDPEARSGANYLNNRISDVVVSQNQTSYSTATQGLESDPTGTFRQNPVSSGYGATEQAHSDQAPQLSGVVPQDDTALLSGVYYHSNKAELSGSHSELSRVAGTGVLGPSTESENLIQLLRTIEAFDR